MWNPEIETMPRDRLETLQLGRLRETVARILRAVPPQAERLRASGIEAAEDISSLADLPRLPFTNKAFLRDHYPFGLLAVPREQVARVHGSSGTRGKPTIVGYTRADLAVWSEVMARVLAAGPRAARDGAAQRLRLWAVHRRARLPPGRRAAGLHCDPDVRRSDRAPGHDAAGPAAGRSCAARPPTR